jgi:hypothetical protein
MHHAFPSVDANVGSRNRGPCYASAHAFITILDLLNMCEARADAVGLDLV